MLTWLTLLLVALVFIGIWAIRKELAQIRDALKERQELLSALTERQRELWDRTLGIDQRTKQWAEHPRCELEQKLWLHETGFLDVVKALAEGRAPTEEEFDRVDKALRIDTRLKSKNGAG